jgi:RNA polymerase sigma-70 factor (ECF subfamily)
VITLKYFEGLSNEEVAAVLGKPIGAVKSLQHRALETLRRVLRPEQIGELV